MPRSARSSRTAKPRARRGTPEGRRARLLLLGAVVLSAGILAAWFPASALYHQRSDLSQAAAQVAQLRAEDAALSQETKNLSQSAEVGRIAREQYQLVSPGQFAFEVLPPSGTTQASPYSGDPGLRGPVTPSADTELPPGSVTTTTTTTTTTTQPGGSHTNGFAGTPGGSGASDFLHRMEQALEFWR